MAINHALLSQFPLRIKRAISRISQPHYFCRRTSFTSRAGKLAYGAMFTLVLPLGLWLWGSHLSCPLPAVRSQPGGTVLLVSGVFMMIEAMRRLWNDGGGLPMNVFPPPRSVTRGVYAWVPHPIYCGFIAACAGVAFLTGSTAGLWIVTPIVCLGCVALVLGYEGPDLRRRLGSHLPSPWLALPAAQGFLPLSCRIGAALSALVPWAVCYWAIKILGVATNGVHDKIVTGLGFRQAAFSNGLRYWSQNRPNCRFSSRQRMSRTFCAPATPQNMPDCLSLRPMTVLQPASTTPEPMNKPRARYSA